MGGGVTRGAPTPRIDSLAREGMRFLNFNMETQCTPSRSSRMTGRWAIRSGTHSVPFGGVADGLTQWEVTIGEALSEVGYATGYYGKWHLGNHDGGGDFPATKASTNGLAFPGRPMNHCGRLRRAGPRTSYPLKR